VTYLKLSIIETKLGRNFITVGMTLNFRVFLDPNIVYKYSFARSQRKGWTHVQPDDGLVKRPKHVFALALKVRYVNKFP